MKMLIIERKIPPLESETQFLLMIVIGILIFVSKIPKAYEYVGNVLSTRE